MADFYSKLLKEINFLRTEPLKYAEIIAKYINYFQGKLLTVPGHEGGIRTQEGARAYKEAINFLLKQSKKRALDPSKGLCRIAEDLVTNLKKPNVKELNNKIIEDTAEQYGKFTGNFSKVIDYGGDSPEFTVIKLIVSDGDLSRSQRDALLSNKISKIGLAHSEHPKHKFCTIIITCKEFENTFDSDDSGLLTQKAEPKKKYVKQKRDPNDPLPPGVASINETEKIIIENDLKKKVTRIETIMLDGSVQIETTKELLEEE